MENNPPVLQRDKKLSAYRVNKEFQETNVTDSYSLKIVNRLIKLY